jgi:hypothetical protein
LIGKGRRVKIIIMVDCCLCQFQPPKIIAIQYHNDVSILFHENLTACRLLYILGALQISQFDWQREASTTHYCGGLLHVRTILLPEICLVVVGNE